MKIKTDIARLPECRLPPTKGFRSHPVPRYHGALHFSKESQERGLMKAREARRKARKDEKVRADKEEEQ
jgi:hypothetical protein